MLFLSASACQEVRGSWLCCSPHQSRILSFSFTHSITENTKLHRHISLGKDIFTLMHKQALTQHPRGEKARIMFRDVAVPKALCWQTAHPRMQIDKHLFVQGKLVSSNLWDGAVGSALQTGMPAATSPFPPSTCSVQPHIVPSTLPTTSPLQFLPHLLLLGICLLPVFLVALFPWPSPWLLFVTSCILCTKFILHPLLCFSCPILPCMIVSTMFFPLNPMWNSLFLVTCLFLHSDSSCPSDSGGEIPWASSVQLLPSGPEGIHWLSHLALPCDFCSSTWSVPLCILPATQICSFSLLLSPICALPFVASASTLIVRSADASPCSVCSVVFVCNCFANSAEYIPSFSWTYVLRQNEGGAEVTWQVIVWNRHCACLPAAQTTMGTSFSPYSVTILVLCPVCAWCLCRCVHVFRCSTHLFVCRGDIFPLLHAFTFVSVESMVLFYWGVCWACRRVPSYVSTWLRCV